MMIQVMLTRIPQTTNNMPAWQGKIQIIKAVRGLTGMGLKEAKDLVEVVQHQGRPMVVWEYDDSAKASDAADVLREAGAGVEVKSGVSSVRGRALAATSPDGRFWILGASNLGGDSGTRYELDDWLSGGGAPNEGADSFRYTWVEIDLPLPTVDPEITVTGEVVDE